MKTIKWRVKSDESPLSDPRLSNLFLPVTDLRNGRLPFGWRGNKVSENRYGDLPIRDCGSYREFYMGTSAESGELRLVLGRGSEVYVTGNHYRDFIQVLHLPFS